jgi:hypothetical protein
MAAELERLKSMVPAPVGDAPETGPARMVGEGEGEGEGEGGDVASIDLSLTLDVDFSAAGPANSQVACLRGVLAQN